VEPDHDHNGPGRFPVRDVHPAAVEGEVEVGVRAGVENDPGLQDRERGLPFEVGPRRQFDRAGLVPHAHPGERDQEISGV